MPRYLLYQALREDLPNPGKPSEEREKGWKLTEYLWRG